MRRLAAASASLSARAFRLLQGAVQGSGAEPQAPGGAGTAAPIACWSLVHGFARLILDGAFGNEEGAAERAARDLLPQVLGHLRV